MIQFIFTYKLCGGIEESPTTCYFHAPITNGVFLGWGWWPDNTFFHKNIIIVKLQTHRANFAIQQ